MKVWLVWNDDPAPDGHLRLVGVFSSEKKADEWIQSQPSIRRWGMTTEEVATDMEYVG